MRAKELVARLMRCVQVPVDLVPNVALIFGPASFPA
jgi:hypothetical protein